MWKSTTKLLSSNAKCAGANHSSPSPFPLPQARNLSLIAWRIVEANSLAVGWSQRKFLFAYVITYFVCLPY